MIQELWKYSEKHWRWPATGWSRRPKVKGVYNLLQPIDLIIADIYMPVKDGLETILQLIRGFSRHDNYCDIGCSRFGATETLTKPFTPQELLHVVEASLTFA